jgi:hypothetical protein
MSHHPNSGKNQNIRIGYESSENVAKFKYLGMTQIRMTFMIKSRVDEIQEHLLSFSPESLVHLCHTKKKTKN